MQSHIPSTSFSRAQRDFHQPFQFQNVDAQDHYVEVHAYTDLNYSVKVNIESCAVQAVPVQRRRPTQTTIESYANTGTQYEPQMLEGSEIVERMKPKNLKNFFGEIEENMFKALISNHVADGVFAQTEDTTDYEPRGQSTLLEVQALQNARYSREKAISAFSHYAYDSVTLVLMAIAPLGWENITKEQKSNQQQSQQQSQQMTSSIVNGEDNQEEQQKLDSSEYIILIWNVADNMQPLAILSAPSAVTSIDVNHTKAGIIIAAGTYSGQVLVYDLDSIYKQIYQTKNAENTYNQRNAMKFTQSVQQSLLGQKFYPSISSSVAHFHSQPITDVKWLHADAQILRSGELQTSANPIGPVQFVSVSPDGYIKLFSLLCVDKDPSRPDQNILVPFLNIPVQAMFPKLKALRPITIQFQYSENPTTFFAIGDAAGWLGFSCWPVAVAGAQAIEDDRKRIEKQQQQNYGDTKVAYVPNKGTIVSAFPMFLSSIVGLEFCQVMFGRSLLMASALDGVKIWILEKSLHQQCGIVAERGVFEEQVIMEQDLGAAKESGFVVVQQLPEVGPKYASTANNQVDQRKHLDDPTQFVDTNKVLAHLNLNLNSSIQMSSQTDMSSMSIQDLNKRALNMPQVVNKTFDSDFPNFNFYQCVFHFQLPEGSITSSCMSKAFPNIIFLGTERGIVYLFDLNDRMHDPLITTQVCVGPVTHMCYIQQAQLAGSLQSIASQQTTSDGGAGGFTLLPEKKKAKHVRDVLMVGDIHGTIHVLQIPDQLVQSRRKDDSKRVNKKFLDLRYLFRRCLESQHYIEYRQSVRQKFFEERAAQEEADRLVAEQAAIAERQQQRK